jgi:predicted RNA-binding protein with PIN domain
MLHYLIDGYNLLFALPQMPPGTWLEKRLGLLLWLTQVRPQGRNEATVVFDNRQGWGSQENHHGIAIVYTSGETADDWISNKVREIKNPRVLVVVSNDKGIQRMIKGTGAKWLSAHDFLAAAKTQRSRVTPQGMAAGDRDLITDELKRQWLDESY